MAKPSQIILTICSLENQYRGCIQILLTPNYEQIQHYWVGFGQEITSLGMKGINIKMHFISGLIVSGFWWTGHPILVFPRISTLRDIRYTSEYKGFKILSFLKIAKIS